MWLWPWPHGQHAVLSQRCCMWPFPNLSHVQRTRAVLACSVTADRHRQSPKLADRMGDSSPIRVTVFASSTPQTTAAFTAASAEFGQLLAQQGGQLVFGGGNAGCMGAVFQGALKAGGKVHGITHRMFCKPGGSSLTEENVSSHTLVAHPEPASRCAQGVLTNRSWLLATHRPQSSSRLRLSRARTSPCANGASSTRETVLSPCPVGLAPSMRCDRERV